MGRVAADVLAIDWCPRCDNNRGLASPHRQLVVNQLVPHYIDVCRVDIHRQEKGMIS